MTHICVSKLPIIASDNALSPGRRQAIIWTSAGILLIGSLGTNFSENLMEIITFSFKKMRMKVLSAKWRPCCLVLNVWNTSLLALVMGTLHSLVNSIHKLLYKKTLILCLWSYLRQAVEQTFQWFNSLAPGRFQRNWRKVIFQLILVIDGWSISCKIVLKWMPMDLTDGKSTLV